MQTVRLGRTGAEVSVVGLGCGGASRLGMARGADLAHAAAIVRRALDLGVTFIDTARAYGTELAVGEGIRGRRGGVFLSSKASPGRGESLATAADLARAVTTACGPSGPTTSISTTCTASCPPSTTIAWPS